MIARRSFIAGSLALLSRPAWPQERKAERIVRVGVLDPQPLAINAGNLEQLRKGLRGAGYSEGRNLAIEYRASDGRAGRYGSLAQELGSAGVDVLIARGPRGGPAASPRAAAGGAWPGGGTRRGPPPPAPREGDARPARGVSPRAESDDR